MAITIPDAFKSHIQSNHTNIYPYVVIDVDGLNIRISTNAFSIRYSDADNTIETYKPLLLNVPSLKESIDLETRKYKINSVSLDISNVKYEGTRFSELVAETSLMNSRVQIYWGSPVLKSNNDALLVYDGTVRRYTHTDDKVKIELEDRSQAYLHKDLPETNLGSDDNVPDKYKNKPIPMVYGHVDRSPCVISSQQNIMIDSRSGSAKLIYKTNTIEGVTEYPLLIFTGDAYAHVLPVIEKVIDGFIDRNGEPYQIESQWYENLDNSGNVLPSNVIKLNQSKLQTLNGLQVRGFYSPINVKLINYDDYHPTIEYINYLETEPINQFDLEFTQSGSGAKFFFALYISLDTPYESEFNDEGKVSINNFRVPRLNGDNTITIGNESSVAIDQNLNIDLSGLFGIGSNYSGTPDIIYDSSSIGGSLSKTIQFHKIDNSIYAIPTIDSKEIYGVIFSGNTQGQVTSTTATITGIVKNVLISRLSDVKNPLNLNYYVNYAGRLSSGENNSPTAPSAIADILEKELGVSTDNIATLPTEYSDMQYAFTVHKKTNSKKLIEGLASASPYIPHFNNQGSFKFDTIPSSNPSSDHTIQESKIIDFTYKRTKIEDVKTKVELKYKIDYARDEFSKPVTKQEDNADLFNYYGLEPDHSLSTLVVDDDRGKYIRDDLTADKFCDWLLDYHKNQHLIMTVKLPLSVGLPIEVGDIVEFDKLLGDVKPYGIDYTDNFILNDQKLFPDFIVTSTNKTLDMVTIECEQLHELLKNYFPTIWATFYPDDYIPNSNHGYAYFIVEDMHIDDVKAEIPALYKIEKMYIPADPAINYWYPTGDKAYWDAGGEVIKEVTNITTISTNTYFGSNPPENATCWKVHLYGDSVITSDLFVHNMTANAEPI